jgi:hypothetical protein
LRRILSEWLKRTAQSQSICGSIQNHEQTKFVAENKLPFRCKVLEGNLTKNFVKLSLMANAIPATNIGNP